VFEEKVTVNLKTGLHARPAAYFVQEANKFAAEISVQKDDKKVNAKSIMGIMSLAISSGTEIIIAADGIDEKEAVARLKEIVTKTE
jgi:phosphotransferase system HPr (HPr) family protein